jgi:hypothetical protein
MDFTRQRQYVVLLVAHGDDDRHLGMRGRRAALD